MDKTAGIIAIFSTIRDKANKFILAQLKERGVHDIVPAHGPIFIALFRNGALPMGQIAQMIDRDKSTITTLVNKLAGLGYLERRKDGNDHRVTLIRLTERGEALEKDFMDISGNLISKVYDGFSDLEKEILFKLVKRVKDNF
ncbi:MAG: MarR family transcriptional regulator [Deltaproteobacteria bacterium]|nr:MarR family transcriptional regulator [Deltaproteobacteria bacterium]